MRGKATAGSASEFPRSCCSPADERFPNTAPELAFSSPSDCRTCQKRTTRCAVDGDSFSKLANAASSEAAELPLRLGRDRMIARAVVQP